jgi:hypothetical protein
VEDGLASQVGKGFYLFPRRNEPDSVGAFLWKMGCLAKWGRVFIYSQEGLFKELVHNGCKAGNRSETGFIEIGGFINEKVA